MSGIISKLAGRMQQRLSGRVQQGAGVRFVGLATIQVHPEAKVSLGDGVVLNSSNRGYHANMSAPVKLLADRSGATISIGSRTRLNGACVHAWERVTIGSDCLIAAGVQIIDANGHELAPANPADRLTVMDRPRPVEIGDAVWIGMNAIVLPGAKIGSGSVIGANSVVSGEIPAGVLAAGQPARVVRKLQVDLAREDEPSAAAPMTH